MNIEVSTGALVVLLGREKFRNPARHTPRRAMTQDCVDAMTLRLRPHGAATTRIFVQVIAICFICPLVMAQDSTEFKPGRFDFTTLVSYRSRMSFAAEPSLPGASSQVALAASPAYSFALGVRVREGNVVEFRWSRQDSNLEIGNSIVGLTAARMTLRQFHCDFNHEYVLRHRAHRLTPFMMASVGITNMSTGVSSSSTEFSAGIGGGIKFFVSQRLGFRIQAEWLPTFVAAQGSALCGASCMAHLGATLGSQAEIAIGPVLRF
jgi:hypothetical protein